MCMSQLGKLRLRVLPSHSYVFFKILEYSVLVDIDTHIKIIHIDSSHTKLLREFPKYRFLAYL